MNGRLELALWFLLFTCVSAFNGFPLVVTDEFNGMIYNYHLAEHTHAESDAICRANNAMLLKITTPDEQERVSMMMNEIQALIPRVGGPFWIGATLTHEGWRWSDDSPVPMYGSNDFQYWKRLEFYRMTIQAPIGDGNCMMATSDWLDHDCDLRSPFICEFPSSFFVPPNRAPIRCRTGTHSEVSGNTVYDNAFDSLCADDKRWCATVRYSLETTSGGRSTQVDSSLGQCVADRNSPEMTCEFMTPFLSEFGNVTSCRVETCGTSTALAACNLYAESSPTCDRQVDTFEYIIDVVSTAYSGSLSIKINGVEYVNASTYFNIVVLDPVSDSITYRYMDTELRPVDAMIDFVSAQEYGRIIIIAVRYRQFGQMGRPLEDLGADINCDMKLGNSLSTAIITKKVRNRDELPDWFSCKQIRRRSDLNYNIRAVAYAEGRSDLQIFPNCSAQQTAQGLLDCAAVIIGAMPFHNPVICKNTWRKFLSCVSSVVERCLSTDCPSILDSIPGLRSRYPEAIFFADTISQLTNVNSIFGPAGNMLFNILETFVCLDAK